MVTLTEARMRNSGWRRIEARTRHSFVLGLDVGQSIDPSAVCVLEHKVTPLETWTANENGKFYRQDIRERFLIRHLERLPLGTPYPAQVQHVANLLTRSPLDQGCNFALDYTGCGRPVADMFVRAGLRPQMILITAGHETTRGGANTWHVPKQLLVSAVEARLHSGELKIAPALAEADAIADELKDFSRKVSEAGRVTFSARAGKHDDLVLAVCIALFSATNRNETRREELIV